MELVDEVIALQYGSNELEALRMAALSGKDRALKAYVYFAAWQGILADKYVPAHMKIKIFRELVDKDLIEVVLGEKNG